MAKRKYDLSGQKFGMLTVLSPVSGGKWRCLCDCGAEKDILTNHLISEHTTSCGCAANEINAEKHTIHNLSKTRLSHTYKGMKDRCYNKNNPQYKYYGGKGVRVCDEWLGKDGLRNFVEWALSHGYTENLTIDRKDSNGDYEPSNCRWADNFTQSNNRKSCVYITANGETHTASEWSRITGINATTIRYRIRKGWDDEKAITKVPNRACV